MTPTRDDLRRREARDRARGMLCEALVLRALADASRPPWILKVRRARKHEDHRQGVDIVVTLDVGRALLQVKRSVRRAAEWQLAHHADPRTIAVVQAGEWESLAVIYGRALGKLILLRERLMGVSPEGRE